MIKIEENYTIDDIATLSAQLDKVQTKSDAWGVLLQSISGEKRLNTLDLAKLYNFFVCNVTRRQRKDWDWLVQALGVEDARPHLHNVFVENGKAVACDGQRVHILRTDLPTGYYNRKGEPVVDAPQYPDYVRFIPANDLKVQWTRVGTRVIHRGREIGGMYKIEAQPGEFIGLNKNYVDEALNGASQITFSYADPRTPITCQLTDDMFFAIMPMRV